MSPPDLGRAARVFEAALRAAPEERERVVEEACGSDPRLRDDVRSLLAHHAGATGFLAGPALSTELDGELLLRTLGRYRILGRLGAGGMGVVYLAEQDNPRRKVALKVLRPGAGGSSARFAHEAELLGRLQHPGIAQIHEAVAADPARGPQPYFAMEYVEGRPLGDHARERALDLGARLELLIAVCEAVQHAHQKGVVHRDLKPANLLVDATGQPKVLDFGVARAIDAELRAETLRTHPGEIIGTLAYMSPEQASGDPERLDTRADVYSLGVVAYELCGGRLPFDFAGTTLTEAVRVIREDEPRRLGTLRRELAGDLETIVAKAMEKEPGRRYASASELAQDLRRFLADEPIAARPPSTLYQLRKFARRHSLLVGGGAAFVALLAGAVAVTARLAARLARERDEAQAVSGFLEDVLSSAELHVGGKDATIADAVRLAKDQADERFADRPELLAALRQRISSIHWSRGELDEAEAERRAALAASEEIADEEPLRRAAMLTSTGITLSSKGELDEAEQKLREAAELYRRHAELDDVERLTNLTGLGTLLLGRAKFAEAEPILREAFERRARVHGPEHSYTLIVRNNLANLLLQTERLSEAEAEMRALMEISRRTLAPSHPNAIQSIYNYAAVLHQLGRFAEAEPLFREVLALDVEHLPAGHWFFGLHRSRFGELLTALERWPEAEAELVAGHEVLATQLGPEHARTQRAVRALVTLYEGVGDPARAAELQARVVEDR